MKLALGSLRFSCLLAVTIAALGQSSVPALSAPQEHTFSLVTKYHYVVADYRDSISVDKSARDVKLSPERALARLVVAARSGDYASWLAMWDTPSQTVLEADRTAHQASTSMLMRKEAARYEGAHLLTFINRGPYIVLRFGSSPQKADVVAFKQSRVGWTPTKEIDSELPALTAARFDPADGATK